MTRAAFLVLMLVACGEEDASVPAPTNFEAVALESGGVHLTWRAEEAQADEFSVERQPEGGPPAEIARLPKPARAYHDEPALGTYIYRVRAVLEGELSLPSREVSVTVVVQ